MVNANLPGAEERGYYQARKGGHNNLLPNGGQIVSIFYT